ncbi:MAG: hypothetical protein ACI4LB_05850 [Candidatus Fimenecus sp.]
MEQNEKGFFAENAVNTSETEPFDPLAAGDMPEIREMPSYEKMRDEAVAQYYKERRQTRIYLWIGILLLVLSLWFFFGIGRHPLILIAAVCVFLSVWWLWDTVKKFPEVKRRYRYRLSRAVEIMSNANVFMQVPKEDWERFDRFWQ